MKGYQAGTIGAGLGVLVNLRVATILDYINICFVVCLYEAMTHFIKVGLRSEGLQSVLEVKHDIRMVNCDYLTLGYIESGSTHRRAAV